MTRACYKVLVLKKIVTIILCLLCAITASALSYASPYKGAGRGGYIYTTSSARQHTISTGLAQAPVASMASAGSSASRGVAYASASAVSMPTVQGIRTSASNISGGIMSGETYAQIDGSGRRRGPVLPPGECEHCQWVWSDEADDYVCAVCGHHLDDHCTCDPCHCNVPLDFSGAVGLFMAALAGAYALYKVRAGKTPYGDVRDANDMRMREAAI